MSERDPNAPDAASTTPGSAPVAPRRLATRSEDVDAERAPPRDDASVLEQIGLRYEGEDLGELRAACTKIARRIVALGQHGDARVLGFVPAGDDVAVPPVLIQLALSLSTLTGSPAAVVDANVRYPGLSALSSESQLGDTVYSTRWVIDTSVALLSPRGSGTAGDVVPQLSRVVADGAELFGHMLVDLTGFELIGEHASAASGMDAVIVVGRTHRTREQALLALAQVLPADKFLGVLLVGS